METATTRLLGPREVTSGSAGRYGLPPDVVATAVKRIGFLGLVVALMAPAGYVSEWFLQPERVRAGVFPFQLVVPVVLAALGFTLCAVAWTRRIRSDSVLDLGLLFEVVVAFGIALSESATQLPPDHPVERISWNCLWISMYVMVVPGTCGKHVLAAVASAFMAPVGLLVAAQVNGLALPRREQLPILLLPQFAAAAWSIPVSRYFFRLAARVSKARAMGSYELIELIGRGGMGEVWVAQHRMLARKSALKLIRPEVLGIEASGEMYTAHKRFEREARAIAALRSPNTVVLHDYGMSEDGVFYYVMELLDGFDLQKLVCQFGPQSASRVVYLLKQVAKSLTEAHENGLVHRDIKPSNIFCCRLGIDYDFVKVLDFGLVKMKAPWKRQTQLTRAGTTTGTPAYMAPEMAVGAREIDGRADLYSLGCVAYWLLTGHLVFEGDSEMAMALAHLQVPPVPPSKRTELRIPAELEDVVLQCLEKDPARRPQNARDLFAQLANCKIADVWTIDAAERWWSTNVPTRAAMHAVTGGHST